MLDFFSLCYYRIEHLFWVFGAHIGIDHGQRRPVVERVPVVIPGPGDAQSSPFPLQVVSVRESSWVVLWTWVTVWERTVPGDWWVMGDSFRLCAPSWFQVIGRA